MKIGLKDLVLIPSVNPKAQIQTEVKMKKNTQPSLSQKEREKK